MAQEPEVAKTKTPAEIIQNQRILDNIMVPVFFESDSAEAKEALQEILRTLLDDPALVVERYHAEHTLSNVGFHGIRIDVWAKDGNGQQLALELQKVTNDEVYPRAVFEGATMVVHSLPAGHKYHEIDKVVIIFFTQDDLEGEGGPLYIYESARNGKPGKMTQVAPTYVFVNGTYRNNKTKLGKLIADVMESNPANMTTPVLRDRMDMLKNTAEGREKLETALDRYVEEYAEEYAEAKQMATLCQLVKQGELSIVAAAKASNMSPQDFEQYMQTPESVRSTLAEN